MSRIIAYSHYDENKREHMYAVVVGTSTPLPLKTGDQQVDICELLDKMKEILNENTRPHKACPARDVGESIPE